MPVDWLAPDPSSFAMEHAKNVARNHPFDVLLRRVLDEQSRLRESISDSTEALIQSALALLNAFYDFDTEYREWVRAVGKGVRAGNILYHHATAFFQAVQKAHRALSEEGLHDIFMMPERPPHPLPGSERSVSVDARMPDTETISSHAALLHLVPET